MRRLRQSPTIWVLFLEALSMEKHKNRTAYFDITNEHIQLLCENKISARADL